MALIFGKRSEANLVGVKPELVKVARRVLEIANGDKQYDFAVIEGLRTMEQQIINFNKGVSRTINGSKHLTGSAIDILPRSIKPGENWDQAKFLPILRLFYKASLELNIPIKFGYNWNRDPDAPRVSSFVDAPHIELI